MFVKIIDTKGKERFINAIYVRSIFPKGLNKSDIDFGSYGSRIRVNQSAEEVAAILNTAMPNSIEAILASEQSRQSNQNAATIAAIG